MRTEPLVDQDENVLAGRTRRPQLARVGPFERLIKEVVWQLAEIIWQLAATRATIDQDEQFHRIYACLAFRAYRHSGSFANEAVTEAGGKYADPKQME